MHRSPAGVGEAVAQGCGQSGKRPRPPASSQTASTGREAAALPGQQQPTQRDPVPSASGPQSQPYDGRHPPASVKPLTWRRGRSVQLRRFRQTSPGAARTQICSHWPAAGSMPLPQSEEKNPVPSTPQGAFLLGSSRVRNSSRITVL